MLSERTPQQRYERGKIQSGMLVAALSLNPHAPSSFLSFSACLWNFGLQSKKLILVRFLWWCFFFSLGSSYYLASSGFSNLTFITSCSQCRVCSCNKNVLLIWSRYFCNSKLSIFISMLLINYFDKGDTEIYWQNWEKKGKERRKKRRGERKELCA